MNDYSKIAKFWVKTTTLHGHRLGDVDDDSDFLKKVITRDKSWLYGYEIETKVQSFRFARIGEIYEKSKGAVGDNKMRVSEVFRELERMLS